MLNKFHQLVAALYAGGYRFLAVFLVDAVFISEISADFSRYFFWAGLISSFAGLPIAARAQAQSRTLTFLQQIILCLILLVVAGGVAIAFWTDSNHSFVVTILAAGLISLFEIKRMERAADGKFALLTVCSIASLALLMVILLIPSIPADWLTAAIFGGLTLPILASYLFIPHKVTSGITLREAAKPVGANAASSLISTGLTFIFPLLLIEEFGHEHSTAVAQVYSIAAMSFSYPRYLSAGFIVAAKQGKAEMSDVKSLSKKIALFALVACSAFGLFSWFLAPSMFNFVLLFVAMQLSQLTLPYANWWTAHSREINVMQLNLISLFILSIFVAIIYAFTTNGEWRGQVILLSFVAYQFLRFLMYSRSKINRSS